MPEVLKPRLLWISDHVVDTGFARVAKNVLEHLRHHWDIHVIGINSVGDPHSYPYPIYPARNGGDIWGLGRFRELVPYLRPDIICILQDPWIVSRFLEFERDEVPMAAYMPVDARNIPPNVCTALNKLQLAIFYTKFGERECRQSGYQGQSEIIPHGVDPTIYRPLSRSYSRSRLNFSTELGPDAFIVGNVNRNQPRKRLDLSVEYFAEWIKQRRVKNAYLYLHCAQQEQAGWNLSQLAHYYGIQKNVILPAADVVTAAEGFPENQMPFVYNSMDVHVSTTLGEGWGLSSVESAACGIPQIVPQYSALGEWLAGAAYFVSCTSHETHIVVNTIGGVADKRGFIEALDAMYRDPAMRSQYGSLGLFRVLDPKFRWAAVAGRFHEVLTQMMIEHKKPKAGDKVEFVDELPVVEATVAAGG